MHVVRRSRVTLATQAVACAAWPFEVLTRSMNRQMSQLLHNGVTHKNTGSWRQQCTYVIERNLLEDSNQRNNIMTKISQAIRHA